ncbi:MAG: aspartyl protease family protein [Pseudomonadales bacterium]
MRITKIIPSVIAVAYSAVGAAVFFMQRDLMFAPSDKRIAPLGIGLEPVDEVTLEMADGRRPYCWPCRFTLLGALLSSSVLATLFSVGTWAGVSPWVDMQVKDGALLLDSSISGIEGSAMIDSGATVNAINRQFLEANSLKFRRGGPIRVSGIKDTEQRKTYMSVPVDLLGTTIQFKGLVDLDLGPPERQMILGAGFLSLYVFQFDYPNNRMRFITRDSLNLKNLKNVESRRSRDSGSPLAKVRLNNKKDVWLLLDTGATGGILLDRKVTNQSDWLHKENVEIGEVRGIYSATAVERYTIDSLLIGGFDIGNPAIAIPLNGKSMQIFRRKAVTGSRVPTKRAKWDGLLGYDVLKHFVVTVDYKGGHVHLQAGSVDKTAP